MNLHSPGWIARHAMHYALREKTETVLHGDAEGRLWEPTEFAKHWPTHLAKLDRMLGGGFYGVSAVGAAGKLGKSTFAIASAIEAAATQQWNVKYINAELDEPEMAERIARYCEGRVGTADAEGFFHVYHAGRGIGPTDLAEIGEECPGEEPVLMVMDSINTLASISGIPYLEALRQFSLWAVIARRQSQGAASFLLVAETNKAGGIKGEQLQFWSDVIVRLAGNPHDGFVDVDVTHSRRTASGSVGRFLRHTPSGSLRRAEECPPQVVRSGDVA